MLPLRSLAVASIVLVLLGCAGDKGDEAGGSSVSTGGSPSSTTPEQSGRLALEEVVSGLDSPLFVAAAPGEESRLYVVEREGRIRVVEDGRLMDKPFLDIVDLVTSGGEQGLLSVAFHPDYAENGLFYVDYTDLAGDTRVIEYRAGGGAPRSVRQLLFVDQPYANHNGGQLQFGPDGLLYVGMGDGGAGGDPEDRAQDLGERLGKLLRLDVNRPGADWEVVAYGLRNPWRFSFDRETGDLYIGDVGQGEWEEIDFLPAGARGLVNFGWDAFEGNHVYEDKEPNDAGRLVAPVAEYSHDAGCSVTGGYVYRGEAVPAARGRYFYGDFCSGTVWSIDVRDGEASRPRREPFTVDSLASFGEDAGGELYLVSLDGAVFRLAER
jgi:glucose/arabinose dehydrogenase